MTSRSHRTLFLLVAAFAVSACSEIDCNDTAHYQGSRLDKPLVAAEGLQPLETNDTHKVPDGAPPPDYVPQTCLVKPPELVAPPKDD